MSTYADALRSQAAELNALADLMEQEVGSSASADTATIATLDGLKTYDPRKDETRGDPRRHDWTGMKPLTGPPPEVSDAATGSDNTQGWLKQLQDEVFALHGDLLSMQDYMDLTIRQEIEDRDLATKEALHQLARDLRAEFEGKIAALASRPDYVR